MGKLNAIATNEYSKCQATIPIVEPQIINGYWSSDIEGVNKIKRARLDDTVYFHIETKGIFNGIMDLQLFDEDTFSDDSKFDGKEIKKRIQIKNNTGVIDLYLPDNWASDLKNEAWVIGPKIQHRDLYWKATYTDSIKKKKIKSILRIDYSNRELYIKPSPIDEGFPELYSVNGELMHLLLVQACDFVRDKVTGEIINVIERGAKAYALNKMAKGTLVDNMGTIHNVGESRYVNNSRIEGITISTNEGLLIETKQSKHFTYSIVEGGQRVVHTSKGIDQYGYWVNKYESNLFNIKGLLKHTGDIFDVFDLIKFGMNPDPNSPIPMIFHKTSYNFLWDAIGIVAYEKTQKIDLFLNETEENVIEITLNEAKLEGVSKVNEVINNRGNAYPEFKNLGYELLDISPTIASQIIHGKFKNIYEIMDASDSDRNKTITLLYREMEHPISEKPITVIETFFIKEYED
ncbi:hypothetical protein [Bacteroides sp. 224]|uniref:hypothetical protein n=1 Tax=Bacteroides sp. 224 TaxID=2302936 RepID=UPI0013CF74EB|nr:hypothetical protein [Bacteroides sp. 224]NDV65220.1 hypothetical protein [Bacteroides sp. 224]